MGVEILSVSLSDESIDRLAEAVARRLGSQSVTQSNYPPAETHRAQTEQVPSQQADPWGGGVGVTQVAPQTPPQPQPQTAVQGQPTCVHGQMRYVAAGFSRNSGKAYPAFWGCPAPRGQAQCKSVPAGQ